MNYDKDKHELVKEIPFFHFWNPYSGFLGGLIFLSILICVYGIYITQGLWSALEFSFFIICSILFARFIETKRLGVHYFAIFFWFAYVTSLLIGLERGENDVKISAIFFIASLVFLTKSIFVWKKLCEV